MDALIQRMFALMTKEPVKGFRAVSLQQVVNADREMWLLAAQEARGKTLTDPAKPLNDILETAFKAHETSYHLLPLPILVGKGDSNVGPRDGPKPENANKLRPKVEASQRLKDRCRRGLHVCCCGGKHSHGDCPNKS